MQCEPQHSALFLGFLAGKAVSQKQCQLDSKKLRAHLHTSSKIPKENSKFDIITDFLFCIDDKSEIMSK